MSSEPIVRVCGLVKTFRLFRRTRDRLAELFGARRHTDFTALDKISFELGSGEALGIIGENGSGKSTLLKLISGVMLPDSGSISSSGKITGLLELGTGFNPELSGRRNIYMNGVYLDLNRRQLAEREQAIVDFAELGDFIDEPLKNYSSGMVMRLGFAIAIHADPDCFIIDEALSVGDVRFQQKCYAKLREFRSRGGSLLFVSHDLGAVKILCDRVLVLDHGKARFIGAPEEAVNQYNEILAAGGKSGDLTPTGYGNGDITFSDCRVLNKSGSPAVKFISGEPMRIEFDWLCQRPRPQVTFGAMIRDRFGQDVFGTNGALLNTLADITAPGKGVFTISALNLGKGMYSVNLAAHTGTTHLDNCYHWWDNAAQFEVLEDPDYIFSGVCRLEMQLKLVQHEKI